MKRPHGMKPTERIAPCELPPKGLRTRDIYISDLRTDSIRVKTARSPLVWVRGELLWWVTLIPG
ncbi:hypothetical protein MTBSS4_120064 [Magnetospirillum sp. SS-4]|nr:hypothetical protein MTBSS4_120064 [Magnetospirillum sp. SS-4]